MTRKTSIFSSFAAMLFLALFLWVDTAGAVPAFARKYEINCSSCHTAYQQLNRAGRRFKEAGYRFPGDVDRGGEVTSDISDFLKLDKNFPISAILVSRPYDEKDSGEQKLRALHEVEIILAGTLGDRWSGYFEMEAEDETGFELEVAPLVLNYHYSDEFNLQFVYGPEFWADSYGFLGNHFRLTRGSVAVIDQSFGGADAGGKLRSARQNIGAYGRLNEKFFYNINYSGAAGDAEGEEPSNISGLFNVDITDDIMIGAFFVDGEDKMTNLEYSRYGIQFLVDRANLRVQGAWVTATDDLVGGIGEQDNDVFSLQAMYVFKDESMRPTWVPLIRFDTYEQNDGADNFDEITLTLTRYITQNIKGYLEYWDRIDAPTPAQEDSRLTLQLHAAF